jgi:hypothetical protein
VGDNIATHITMPTHPNKLFALPIIGLLGRLVALVPYLIWVTIIDGGARFAVSFGRLAILFTSKYPHMFQELTQDRINLSTQAQTFLYGLDDRYPSFTVNKKSIEWKIALIVLGLAGGILDGTSSSESDKFIEKKFNEWFMKEDAQIKESGYKSSSNTYDAEPDIESKDF